jgi:N6-L-threonylcarbamoyladenine synthase
LKILGIETSCDETAAAVVENGTKVLSNVIASSVDMHELTGGVVPEVAAREHLRQISPVIDKALSDAACTMNEIDSIAVTGHPGLIASLLVGINTAEAIAYIHQKPLIKLNHIHGHIYANFLERETPPEFPLLVLTISGGHNELILMKGHHDFEVIGETLDDAAGEAFDKVARLLGLGFPGGPVISKRALDGNEEAFDFPRVMLDQENRFNFSFSGLKSAVRREVQKLESVDDQTINDLAASFQVAVIEVLVEKLALAADEYDVKEIHLAGGVSANRLLRQKAQERIGEGKVHWPIEQIFCTDNAAMMAGAGYWKIYNKE